MGMDIYAPSYSRVASQEAGAVADQAERWKSDKNSNMDPYMYLSAPVVIETLGVFGKWTLSFLKDLACLKRKPHKESSWGKSSILMHAITVRKGLAPFAPYSIFLFLSLLSYYIIMHACIDLPQQEKISYFSPGCWNKIFSPCLAASCS